MTIFASSAPEAPAAVVAMARDDKAKKVLVVADCAQHLPEGFAGSLDAFPFVVGNDVGRKNNSEIFPNIFRMDDLLLFNGAFTDEDAEKLKQYYGR